jgi:hypothetical protein
MKTLAVIAVISTVSCVDAVAATFDGYECVDKCQGHAAGYDWAENHGITDPHDCPSGNSQSFHEGCLSYTDNSSRGSQEDDEGIEIER